MKRNRLSALAGASVLMMALPLFTLASTYAPEKPSQNIVQVAAGAGQFNTLVTALKAAGLDKTLEGKGPFTVFAPTDEAFAKLPPGTVEALLKDIPKLKSILLYHVVSGDVRAADVANLSSAQTVGGQRVAVEVGSNGIKINDSMVVKADVTASNGVIHIIDTVLLPKS
jgi:uncharacterized surface protein with fasciclin (FAS1) repeats